MFFFHQAHSLKSCSFSPRRFIPFVITRVIPFTGACCLHSGMFSPPWLTFPQRFISLFSGLFSPRGFIASAFIFFAPRWIFPSNVASCIHSGLFPPRGYSLFTLQWFISPRRFILPSTMLYSLHSSSFLPQWRITPMVVHNFHTNFSSTVAYSLHSGLFPPQWLILSTVAYSLHRTYSLPSEFFREM
jgi:hypothetical protein